MKKYPMSEAIRLAYQSGEDDETLEPRVLIDGKGNPIGRFQDGDSVIFYDIRGEREVELCQSLLDPHFAHFPRAKNVHLNFVTMIPYDNRLPTQIAFPPKEEIRHTLSEVISQRGLRQVKISESEKAIHVSYFLNGKRKEPFSGEERMIIPSPKDVPLFDQKPEMNASVVTEAIKEKLQDPGSQFIFANFANIDVVGHIENEKAILQAVATVDDQLGLVIQAAKQAGVITVVTADHGTAEKWYYPDGSIDTGHTNSPVPFILIDPKKERRFSWKLRTSGELADVAPTVLQLLGLPKPEAMTGESLFVGQPTGGADESGRVLLVLLDGWGVRAELQGNLIARAQTPVMDTLRSQYPYTTLMAAGEAVGLAEGTVGNSEAGHLHIGAGRRIYSDRLHIDQAIQNGSFFQNEAFLWAIEEAKKNQKSLHLLGIVSFFSSHGSMNHLLALLELAQRESVEKLYLHCMLGRRGEHKESGADYIERIERETENLGCGRVTSVIGRYWSLDREENWNRIEKTYRMLIDGQGFSVPEG